MSGKGVEIKGLCVAYFEKNNGEERKIIDLPEATLTFDEQGDGKFIRGPTDEIYNISNMEIMSFIFESAQRI